MDSLTAAASSYVASELGVRFLDPPPFDLTQCYKDSTSQTPLIFILSQGSDPVSELHTFAKEMKMSRRFESISLGKNIVHKVTGAISTWKCHALPGIAIHNISPF